MAVGADDFALFHFIENVLPPAFREVMRNLESLLASPAHVVELEHDWIALSAVDARVRGEVIEEEQRALDATQILLDASLLDVPGLIG